MSRKHSHTRVLLRALAIAAGSFSLATVVSIAVAETLENLMDSKAMQDFKISKTTQNKDNKAPPGNPLLRGVEPDSNFASLWSSGAGPQSLLNWVGAKLPYFTFKRPRASRSTHFVTAEADLLNFDRVQCTITIRIPHPSITPLVEGNILEEFRKLRPPVLEVVGEKPIPLTVGQGTLYEHKSGSASLLIPISQHGVLTITTLYYKNAEVLIEIAKGLDIDRLNRKLDS